MRPWRDLFIFFSILLISQIASAKVFVGADLSYIQDGRAASSNTLSRTGSFTSAGFMIDLNGKERVYLGAIFAAGGVTSAQSGQSSETFSHQDVILGGTWFMDRQKLFSTSLGYGVTSTAFLKDSSGSPREQWTGTSLYGKFGINPEFKNWSLGIALLYHQGNYTQKTVHGTATTASLQRTMMWPALAVGYRW